MSEEERKVKRMRASAKWKRYQRRNAATKEYNLSEIQDHLSQRKPQKPVEKEDYMLEVETSTIDITHTVAEHSAGDEGGLNDEGGGYSDGGGGYSDDNYSPPQQLVREVFFLPSTEYAKKPRKEFWNESSPEIRTYFAQSFELNEHPDPCLIQPDICKIGRHHCSCPNGKDFTVYCYMLHRHTSFTFRYCNEHTILKTLLLLQMLPSSTVYPKVAIHFSVFEKLMSLKMNGYISNYAFVKSQNEDNFLLANYNATQFKFLNNGLFNTSQIMYRNIKAHVLNDVYFVKNTIKDIDCHACHNSERVGVVLDGNFQMKRKDNKKIIENNEEHPSILATTSDVHKLFGENSEVEKFENEKDDCRDEACGLDEIENSFRAYTKNDGRKNSERFDELGLFSMNCARHGIPMRLYDIYGGEARKYPLACIDHLVSKLDDDQTVLIMYDIICLCKQKLEACIPELRNRDPLYLVTVFHAYAHSMHCQVEFHPRVVDRSGYTDGEGVERFWSTLNRFSGMTRSMSKYNRKALITDVVNFFKQNKMLEIPNQVFKKYNKAFENIKRLNITNKEFTELKKRWDKYVQILSSPTTPSGINLMLEEAEKQSKLHNKSRYIRLCAQYLQITENLKDPNNKKITNTRLINQSNSLFKQIRAISDKYGFRIVTSLDDTYFVDHQEEVNMVRYQTLDEFLKYLIFSIIMRESRLAQPGTAGTATAARIIVSLEKSRQNGEAIVNTINRFVDKNFVHLPDREKEEKKKKTLGREIEKVRKTAKENNLSLPNSLNDWHSLKRNVEEVALLIGEAKRILENYQEELSSLQQALDTAPSFFIRIKYLNVRYRYLRASTLLSEIATAEAPIIHHRKQTTFYHEKVVRFPTQIVLPASNVASMIESGLVDPSDFPGDTDFTQGGEPNPDRHRQFTMEEVFY